MSDSDGHEQRLWEALQDAAPADAVYRLAATLRDEGVSQADLYRLYVRVHRQLPNEDDDPRFDAMADTLDYIIGFCSSHMKLFPHFLGREEREKLERE